MAEKINISNKETSYQGLWYNNRDHRYTSAVIDGSSLSNLKGKFRIVMYKNRFHKDGDNRPNYNIKFCGSDVDDILAEKMSFGVCIADTNDDEELIRMIEEYTGKRMFSEEEVYKIIHGMQTEYGLKYGNDLIEDYIPLEV